MEQTSVQKLARVLRVLVIITFVCNLIALYFVPTLAAMMSENRGLSQEDLLSMERLVYWLQFSPLCWNPVMWMVIVGTNGDSYWLVLTLFLFACGICTATILWQGKRVLGTILKGNPFVLDNAKSLKRAAVCCFVISGAALVRVIWGLFYYQSIAPLLTYNALFVPIFLMGGLLLMVMSALFRQAAELQAENDLTI